MLLTHCRGNTASRPADNPKTRHNADEGDRSIKRLAVASRLRFRSGHGSCVRDSYTTGSGNPYVELACLVAGHKGATVIVGAAPPQVWQQVSPTLERAIASFAT